jgi:hypothetical protein
MDLNELFPEKPEFFLSSMNKTYQLRLPTIADSQYIVNKYGDGDTSKAERWLTDSLNKLKWDNVCKIIYPLLIDKSDFLAKKKPFIDEDGNQGERVFTGPELLLESLLSVGESYNMLKAYLSAKAAAEPAYKEMLKQELKKNLKQQSSTGEKSSTSSQANMDTLLSNSGVLPSAS